MRPFSLWWRRRVRRGLAFVGLGIALAASALLNLVGPFAELRSRGFDDAPETRLAMTSDEVHAWIESLGPDGRSLYARFQWLDLLTPIVFGGGLFLAVTFVAQETMHRRRIQDAMRCVPLAMGMADWLENALLLRILAQFPAHSRSSEVVGPISSLKLVLVSVSVLVVIGGFLFIGLRKRPAPTE